VDREKFEELIVKALGELPEEFQSKLENIDVLIADEATPRQLARMGLRHGANLLGLYEGVPLTEWSRQYGMVPPECL